MSPAPLLGKENDDAAVKAFACVAVDGCVFRVGSMILKVSREKPTKSGVCRFRERGKVEVR